MGVRASAGTQPIKAEPELHGGGAGVTRFWRLSPCGCRQHWSHAAGVERSGGCGGSSPRIPRTLRWIAEGGSPRGERNVPPFGRDDREDGRARQRARVPRAYVRGISLCLSWFQVCYICVFACNRVTHLLMRNLALEDISIGIVYLH